MKLFEKHKKSILIFILISLFLYSVYYFTFNKLDVIVESFFLNLAFLPIYVLFTTFILDELLSMREKPLLYRKRNTTIGLFYSEMGTTLLKNSPSPIKILPSCVPGCWSPNSGQSWNLSKLGITQPDSFDLAEMTWKV